MCLHLFFSLVSHDLSVPFHLSLFLLLILPPSSLIFSTFIPHFLSSSLISFFLSHPLHLLHPSPFSHQFSMPFPCFLLPLFSLPPPTPCLFSGQKSPDLCIAGRYMGHEYPCSMCRAYYALFPVIILFLCSCHFL